MKKIFEKGLSLVLATATAVSVGTTGFAAEETAAYPQTVSPVFEIFTDLAERLASVFIGSTNPKSEIEFICDSDAIFEARKHFVSSHASTIVKMPNGNILSAWFAGKEEGSSDVRIWYSVYDGQIWSEPKQIETSDTQAHWNPVLESNTLYTRLYYKVGDDTKTWVTKYVDTFDFGATWTEPKELVEGDTSGGRGPVKNKCLTTSDGIIIAPASTEQGSWKAFFDISEDGGKTWTKTDYVASKNLIGADAQMIQPALWEDKEGGIHAMFRTKSGRIYRSDSYDGGYTWCEAYSTGLMNNSSGIDCVMTDNGWLWLAYNPIGIEGLRNRLILSVSKDNGETWEDVMTLEEAPINPFSEYSYPSIVEDGNNLYISYTYERKQTKYAFIEFTEN